MQLIIMSSDRNFYPSLTTFELTMENSTVKQIFSQRIKATPFSLGKFSISNLQLHLPCCNCNNSVDSTLNVKHKRKLCLKMHSLVSATMFSAVRTFYSASLLSFTRGTHYYTITRDVNNHYRFDRMFHG